MNANWQVSAFHVVFVSGEWILSDINLSYSISFSKRLQQSSLRINFTFFDGDESGDMKNRKVTHPSELAVKEKQCMFNN